MKKIKWILFIFMIFLLIIFLLGTCKKTKAIEPYYHTGTSYYLDPIDDNAYIIMSYQPCFNVLGNYMISTVFFDNNDLYYYLSYTFNNGSLIINFDVNSTQSYLARLFSYSYTYSTFINSFFVVGPNYVDNEYKLAVALTVYYLNDNNTVSESTHFYYFDNIASQYYDDLNYEYNDASLQVTPLAPVSFTGNNNYYIGNYNFTFYPHDTTNQPSFSEEYADVKSLFYAETNASLLYTYAYNIGYTEGYQLGYDEGYLAGQTAGYNSGYTAGYNDGVNDNQTAFDRGYSDGYQDGYAYGTVHGYDEGYQTGYNVGLNEGIQGATPVSQTVTLLGSIFGAIGTVLSIQLFPGFTLGLLILVPLFFAVLGLILWIWRRN